MSPQSNAYQVLVAWQRDVLARMPAAASAARLRRLQSGVRSAVEPLPPRRLFSVVPVGGDTAVNVTTSNNQITPDVAIAADGSFVIVWESDGNLGGDGRGIFARLFNTDGTPKGGEFVVNQTTTDKQTEPAVAIDDAGNFVVAWASDQASGQDIFVRHFDAAGTATTGEMLVNTLYVPSDQLAPAVGMNRTGGAFVVAWEGDGWDDADGVWAQRFDGSAVAVGSNFRVNAVTGSKQRAASVAVAADDSFVITHTDESAGHYIAAQRFDAAGAGQGQFAVDNVSGISGNDEEMSSVAIADGGSFVVTWSDTGASSRIAVRRFASDGTPLGAAFRADPAATHEQREPRIAADGAGNFIVAWRDNELDGGGLGIGAAAFNADGTNNGGVFQANAFADHDQEAPSVALNASGRAVIAWGKESAADNDGVTARRFDLGVVLTANQAPANTVPPGQSAAEGASVVFSVANGNAILIADADAGGAMVKVTLDVPGGRLTLASTAGLNFTTGDGAADATLVFTGTISAINTALDGLAFSAASEDDNGAYTLTITTDDQGNTGTGGSQTDSDSIGITLTPVNDAPVNNTPDDLATDQGILVLSSGSLNAITITDVDAGSGQLQVTLTASGGTMTVGSTSGLTFTTGNGVSDGTMVFKGTLANINAALEGLEYRPPLLFAGPATITVTTNDLGNTGSGGAKFDSGVINLTADAVNDAPVNTVPGAQTTDEDTDLVFAVSEGNAILVTDSDAGGAEVRVTLSVTNGLLSLGTTSGLTFLTGSGAADASMSFTGTLADINTALDGLVYSPNLNYSGSDALQVETSDLGATGPGGAQSDSDSIAIAVNSVADGPALAVPATVQAVNEDVPRVFSAANGNAITISDLAVGGTGPFTVTLSAPGSLTLAQTGGLTFTTGDGTSDPVIVFTGSVSAVNAALNGLTFTAADNPLSSATLSISATDGTLSAIASVSLSVTAVNDAPVHTVPAAPQAIDEDHSLVFSVANGKRIAVSDYDIGGGSLRVTITATGGVMTLANLVGLTMLAGDGSADATLAFEGAPSWINQALDGLMFDATPNFAGAASLRIQTSDQGGTGAGGAKSDDDTISIAVAAMNDAPTLSAPAAAQAIAEDGLLTLAAASGNSIVIDDIDLGNGAVRVRLDASRGVMSLSTIDGLAFVNGDGAADAVMLFTGMLAAVNAALEGMTFTPDLSYSGAASIAISVKDQGNTGQGGNLGADGTVSIVVSGVDDPPTLAVSPTALAYGEGDGAVAVDPSLALADPEGTIEWTSVRLIGYVAGEDVLRFSDAHGITGYFSPTLGMLWLSGAATASQYENALRSITYENLSANPTTTPRGVRFSVGDGTSVAGAERMVSVGAAQPPVTPPQVPPTPPPVVNPVDPTNPLEPEPQPPIDVIPVDPQPNPGDPTDVDPVEPTGPAVTDPPAIDVTPPIDTRPPVITSGSGEGSSTTVSAGGTTTTPPAATIVEAVQDAVPTPAAPAPVESAGGPQDDPKNALVQSPLNSLQPDEVASAIGAVPAPGPSPVGAIAPTTPAPTPEALVAAAARQVAFVANDGQFWRELDTLREEVKSPEKQVRLLAGVATIGSLGLSVLYVLWTIRAGYLLASLLSSMPAWRFIDPLPILDEFDSAKAARRRRRDAGRDGNDADHRGGGDGDDGESLASMVSESADGALKGAAS